MTAKDLKKALTTRHDHKPRTSQGILQPEHARCHEVIVHVFLELTRYRFRAPHKNPHHRAPPCMRPLGVGLFGHFVALLLVSYSLGRLFLQPLASSTFIES
jgi:hypothetical protein